MLSELREGEGEDGDIERTETVGLVDCDQKIFDCKALDFEVAGLVDMFITLWIHAVFPDNMGAIDDAAYSMEGDFAEEALAVHPSCERKGYGNGLNGNVELGVVSIVVDMVGVVGVLGVGSDGGSCCGGGGRGGTFLNVFGGEIARVGGATRDEDVVEADFVVFPFGNDCGFEDYFDAGFFGQVISNCSSEGF